MKSVVLKNRIVVSPMCEYSAEDGHANDWHLVHLGSRAVGGAGLIIMEATAVSPEGRITYGDTGIWSDDHVPFLKRITSFIANHGSVPGIQIAHAGRKASSKLPWEGGAALKPEENAWQCVAPSAIPFKEGDPVPTALDAAGISKVISDFTAAAKRSLDAGFKVLEIHAAHGYLLNEFMSPISNKRTDEYGGSFENRIRLLLAVIDSVNTVWPKDLPLFVRISATDWHPDGWTIEDSIRLAPMLRDRGVDLIDCSSAGNVAGVKIPVGPLYQVPLAARIRNEGHIATGAVGLITTAQEAEGVLTRGEADLILLARQSLRDPYFPLHAAKELGVDVEWPVQYLRAKN
jgi:2,4-dienoyl-CoA reductase-like NADH-dependent reductase (Old Yellow Enzyme family)